MGRQHQAEDGTRGQLQWPSQREESRSAPALLAVPSSPSDLDKGRRRSNDRPGTIHAGDHQLLESVLRPTALQALFFFFATPSSNSRQSKGHDAFRGANKSRGQDTVGDSCKRRSGLEPGSEGLSADNPRRPIGIECLPDQAPQSRVAKEVSELAFDSGAGGQERRKGTKISDVTDNFRPPARDSSSGRPRQTRGRPEGRLRRLGSGAVCQEADALPPELVHVLTLVCTVLVSETCSTTVGQQAYINRGQTNHHHHHP